MFFSDNIKRLVQNYRIGYLRMMQYQLRQNNLDQLNILINQFNDYFPNDVLPIDPWLGFEIIDKIFKPLNDTENQKKMIASLVGLNADVNVKLIAIIRALELGHYELTEQMIQEHIIKGKVPIDSKLALFFETINNIGYHSSIDALIENILNKHDISKFSVSDKYSIFGVLYQIQHTQGTIKMGQSLLIEHYANDLEDIDMQKYIADILLESMGNKEYIDFCVEIFKNHRIEGMLYTLVNAYQSNQQHDMAIEELDTWIKDNPSNKRMLNKRSKVLKNMSIQ